MNSPESAGRYAARVAPRTSAPAPMLRRLAGRDLIGPMRSRALLGAGPLPVPDLRHVPAVFVDVLLVLDQLVLELLLQVGALLAGLRQAVDGVHDEVEPVHVVEHRHVERRCDGALLLVA